MTYGPLHTLYPIPNPIPNSNKHTHTHTHTHLSAEAEYRDQNLNKLKKGTKGGSYIVEARCQYAWFLTSTPSQQLPCRYVHSPHRHPCPLPW